MWNCRSCAATFPLISSGTIPSSAANVTAAKTRRLQTAGAVEPLCGDAEDFMRTLHDTDSRRLPQLRSLATSSHQPCSNKRITRRGDGTQRLQKRIFLGY